MIRQSLLKRLDKLEADNVTNQREVDPLMIKFLEQDPEASDYLHKLYDLSIKDPLFDSPEAKKHMADYKARYDDWREYHERYGNMTGHF